MKKRRLIIATLSLLVLGGLFALPPIRVRVVGYLRGEHFFQGRPTSYWRDCALKHDQLRKDRSSRGWGGTVVFVVPPPPASLTDRLLSFLRISPASDEPDLRVFEGNAAALEVLTDLLRDPEPGVEQSACEGLERIGPLAAPAIPILVELLIEGEPFIQGPAAEALGKIGTAAVPPLLEKLTTQDRGEEAIFLALGKIGPGAAAAIPALSAALKDGDRHHASRALSHMGPQAVPALLEALESSDWQVRWAATLALIQTEATPAVKVPVFIRLLGDKDGCVRQSAAGGLGRLGAAAQEGVSALIEASKDRERYAAREAIDALGHIGPKAQAAIPVLTRMLEEEDSDYIRQCLHRALGRIKGDIE